MQYIYKVIGLVCLLVSSIAFAQSIHSSHRSFEKTFPSVSKKFVCPMHSHIVKDHQGDCPICGMDLVEVLPSNTNTTSAITVSGAMKQALAIKVEPATRQTLWQYLNTVGRVQYDESEIYHQHSRVSGWVESLAIHSAGEQVKKGQLLYQIYSPELINAQNDFLLALEAVDEGDPQFKYRDLMTKAKQRLRLLGFNSKQIQQLEINKQSQHLVSIHSPQDGIIQKLNVRKGMYIEPNIEMLAIANLKHLWVIAEVFDPNLVWLSKGTDVEIKLISNNPQTLMGKVDYIYPELDPITRSVQVRIIIPNPQTPLKANTLVNVSLFGGPKHDVITVPQEALIQVDNQNRVILQSADNSFTAVPVTIGLKRQGRVEILSGITQGQSVVVSGQFLLDSEASLRGSLNRLMNNKQGEQ
ncbi:MAG: efflux RND transporter periplasmic adaptor subunit [Parashewanella sp.]